MGWTWGPGVLLLGVTLTAGCRSSAEPRDQIEGFPPAQQESIARNLWREWPLTVGGGRLGCNNGAVAFRSGGKTYAVNDAAAALGFTPLDSLLVAEPSKWPSNPLKRVTQADRMKIFEESARCGTDNACAAPEPRRRASTRRWVERGLGLCEAGRRGGI